MNDIYNYIVGNELPFDLSKLEGGSLIAQPDFASLTPLVSQQGPFFSPEMKCYAAAVLVLGMCSWKESPVWTELTDTSFWDGYITSVMQTTPAIMNPYVNAVKHLKAPRVAPATAFPANIEAFRYNEAVLVANGNRACSLKDGLAAGVTRCLELTKVMLGQMVIQGAESTVFNDESYRNFGFELAFPKGTFTKNEFHLFLGINPKLNENYRLAADMMTKEVLQDPCFFKKDNEEIVNFLKNLQKVLIDNIPHHEPAGDGLMRPGEYRDDIIYVRHDPNLAQTLEGQIDFLKKNGATNQEIGTFKKSISKFNAALHDKKIYLPNIFTKEEANVWKKLMYITPEAILVPQLIDQYISNLKDFVARDLHPIALAAWAHCELGRIHPFNEANGRVARLLMNALLVRGGYEPVIITNDQEYTKAVNADGDKPGAFAEYLAKLIQAQSKGQQVFIRA